MWGRPPVCRFGQPLDALPSTALKTGGFHNRQTGGLPHAHCSARRWFEVTNSPESALLYANELQLLPARTFGCGRPDSAYPWRTIPPLPHSLTALLHSCTAAAAW